MTWDEIFILLIMVMGLFAIDMLIAKFNLTAGRIVAVLTFFVMMPLGLVAGIVALVCMNIRAKKKVDYKIEPITKELTGNREHATALKSNQADLERLCRIAEKATSEKKNPKKKFAMIFQNSGLIGAIILSAVLLYLVDLLILTFFPEAKFPVIIYSISLFPVIVILMMKFLDYLNDKIGMKIEEWENNPNKYRQITGVGAFEVKRKFIYEQQEKNRESENMVSDSSASFGGYATPQDDPYYVSDDHFKYDPDYQDYLQGNIRPSRYQIEHKVADNGEAYTTLKSEQTELAAFYREQNEKAAGVQAKKMIELVIPEGTTEIKEREFDGREDIISVVIPESVKKIGERAFFSCENLEKVTILRGVIDIGANSFAHCTNLSSVVIPDSVTTIGQAAFYHCTKLTSIVIPKSIKEIGHSSFSDCENLTDVTVKSESETRIGQNAFGGCHNLSSVKLHEGVISIGVGAFSKCTNLSKVVIPDSVVWLGGYAFENCVNLTRVALPKKLNSMGGYVFYGCKNLTSIDIPENIIPVLCSNGSLSGCSALKSFKIPDGVTEIANSMFSNCENLTTVEIPNTVEQIGSHAFSDCKNLEFVKLPSSVKAIGEGAFDGCEKISDNIKRTALSKIPRIVSVATSYNTPYEDPQCDDNYNPDKYNYELRVAGNGQEYYARIN